MKLEKNELLYIIEALQDARMYYDEMNSKRMHPLYENPFGQEAVKGFRENREREEKERFETLIIKLKMMAKVKWIQKK